MAGGTKYGLISRLKLDELYNNFMGLEERQQWMAIGGACVLLIGLIFLPITCASSKLSKLEADYQKGSKNREVFGQKIAEYQTLQAELAQIKKSISGKQTGSLNSLIESIANEIGIASNIDRLKPMNLGSTDYYEEDGVDAAISNITLDQLSQFLRKIDENKTTSLHIKKLEVKTRYNKRDQLSVSMQIGTYRLKGDEGE